MRGLLVGSRCLRFHAGRKSGFLSFGGIYFDLLGICVGVRTHLQKAVPQPDNQQIIEFNIISLPLIIIQRFFLFVQVSQERGSIAYTHL